MLAVASLAASLGLMAAPYLAVRPPLPRAAVQLLSPLSLDATINADFIVDDEACDERCVIALFGLSVSGLSEWREETRSINWQGMSALRSALPMLSELQATCICAGEGTALEEVLPAAKGREFWICSRTSSLDELGDAFDTCQFSEAFTEFYGEDVFVCTRRWEV